MEQFICSAVVDPASKFLINKVNSVLYDFLHAVFEKDSCLAIGRAMLLMLLSHHGRI
jgi:hypothetical protein